MSRNEQLAVRVIFIAVDHWPLIALKRSLDLPIAVVKAGHVIDVSPVAQKVKVGMTQRTALAKLPRLEIVEQDEAAEFKLFESVISVVENLTPWVTACQPGEMFLPALTPARFYGSEKQAVKQLLGAVKEELRLLSPDYPQACRIGVSEGQFAASLAAKLAKPGDMRVIPKGRALESLAHWPIATLGDPKLTRTLFQLGITTLGQWAKLKPGDVLGRFGSEAALLHQKARGLEVASARQLEQPKDLTQEWIFETPAMDVSSCRLPALALAQDLVKDLQARGLSCVRLHIACESENSETHERYWQFQKLRLSAEEITKRVTWQVESWLGCSDRPSAGIRRLGIAADQIMAAAGTQLSFWGVEPTLADAVKRLIPRLGAAVGESNVIRPVLKGGVGPYEQFEFIPANTCDVESPLQPDASVEQPWPGAVGAPSPSYVSAPGNLEVEVISATEQAVQVSGRGQLDYQPRWLKINNRNESIVKWAGPWLDSRKWWLDDPIRHARLQVVTARSAYLLVVSKGRWYLEASYL